MMIKRMVGVGLMSLLMVSCTENRQETMGDLTARVFALAKQQYTQMDEELTAQTMPRSINEDGSLRTSDIGWWCSGFYPGSLWYIYAYTQDEQIKRLALKNTEKLDTLLRQKTDHDIGFQLMSSYGNAFKQTGNEEYAELLYKGAQTLAGRFNEKTGVTQSWNFLRKGWKYPVIIDNMMNLELLTFAAHHFNNEELMRIAKSHADVTMRNHFRPDFTCYHLVNYDPEDGHVISRETVQGYADESAWSRGQAWALYGYTMMARETREERYLAQAKAVGDMLLKRLPADGIPFWDFDDPAEAPLRDASAAAIMAAAYVELSGLTGNKTYLQMAEKQLRMLASPEYLAEPGTNACFLLKHGVGNMPEGSEIDVPLSYADYYFLEALMRYRNQD